MVPSYSGNAISGWSNYPGMVTSHMMNENEMGYRGSKSNFTSKFVKEQRVDGSYCINLMQLRCTLMGFERNYQFKIPSNQLNKAPFSTFIPEPKLNPWLVSGFADAESCFSVSIRPSTNMKTGWRISPSFLIKLHIKDIAILEKIKYTLDVGTVRKAGTDMAVFAVESVKDLQVIVNHFDKYPLLTAKSSDFLIFKQCFEIIKEKRHLTPEGLLDLVALKGSLNWGLSDGLVKAFPNVVSVKRPEYVFESISDPNWVAGFTSGDGSFHITTGPAGPGNTVSNVRLRFSINLNIREKALIEGLVLFFKSYGTKLLDSSEITISKNYYISGEAINLQFGRFSDIVNIIIPFFEEYGIVGVKSLDFIDFKKAADIVKNKEHLNPEGFNEILKLKSGMTKNREW
jgi:hypothetical protein